MAKFFMFTRPSRLLAALLMTLVIFDPSLNAWAQKGAGPVGYELLDEIQDSKTKTYTIEIEVWSADKDANELAVIPRTEGDGLEIMTPKKVWKNVKKLKRYKHSISVKNASGETRNLSVDLERKIGERKDSKTISVLVAPQ